MTAEHPEGWTPRVSREDLRRALEKVDAEAGEHTTDYAAGMRHARLIVEEELLD